MRASRMWQVILRLSLGWPQLYSRCFPTSTTEKIMGATGVGGYEPGLATNVSSASVPLLQNEWSVTCDGGAIVQNVITSQSSSCPNTLRESSFGRRTVTAADPTRPINVLCITGYGHKWKYYSTVDADTLSSDAEHVYDVVVIGEGMGGSAAAYAAWAAGAHVAILSAGVATTALSSGVVWFPRYLTTDLRDRKGGEEADAAALGLYTLEGNASFDYWDRALGGLSVYSSETSGPAYDYEGTDRGNAYRYSECSTSTCGADTTGKLRALAGITPLLFTVVEVLDAPSNRLAVRDAGGNVILAKAVVFAAGGSAFRDGQYENILAQPENTGIHLDVAVDRNWELSRTDVHWHLEYRRANEAATPQERWFAITCGAVDGAGNAIAEYDTCDDYSQRSQALLAANSALNQWYNTSDPEELCAGSNSGSWWRNFFDGIGFLSEQCGPNNMEVAAGVIDSKSGFKMTSRFASQDDGRFFAAGTSAASVLGNTYFGPGATLGWALHTGRIAGTDAAAVTVDNTAKPQYRLRTVPALFGSASILILVGAIVHFWPSTRFLHYILMPLAMLLIAIAITLVVKEDNGVMKAASPDHRNIGWVLVGWITLQSFAGALILAGKISRRVGGVIHRGSGILILGLLASMPFTAQKAAAFYNTRKSYVAPIIFAVTVVVVIGAAVYNIIRLSRKPAPVKTNETRATKKPKGLPRPAAERLVLLTQTPRPGAQPPTRLASRRGMLA